MVWVVRCEEQSTWAPAGQNEGDVGLNGELHSSFSQGLESRIFERTVSKALLHEPVRAARAEERQMRRSPWCATRLTVLPPLSDTVWQCHCRGLCLIILRAARVSGRIRA